MASFQELVDGFMVQKRIAVVGVSRAKQDAPNANYKKLREAGYQVFAINPNATEVEGDPCYPNAQAIPGGIEAALIVLRPEDTLASVKDCVAAGAKYIWMHRSIGNSVSPEAVEYCKQNNINVLPGGCPMMFVKPVDGGHKVMGLMGKWFGWMPKQV